MKLDAWQLRLAVQVLEAGVSERRTANFLAWIARGPEAADARGVTRSREQKALEAMAAALESGESLEVGP